MKKKKKRKKNWKKRRSHRQQGRREGKGMEGKRATEQEGACFFIKMQLQNIISKFISTKTSLKRPKNIVFLNYINYFKLFQNFFLISLSFFLFIYLFIYLFSLSLVGPPFLLL
jgi:hypothetical protein